MMTYLDSCVYMTRRPDMKAKHTSEGHMFHKMAPSSSLDKPVMTAEESGTQLCGVESSERWIKWKKATNIPSREDLGCFKMEFV